MAREKYRIRFRKGGDLRLVSHLDLMRCFERMLRRAALPFRTTEGFHPTPRLVLPSSLPLGLVGRNEVAELELTEDLDPGEVFGRLSAQAPPGIRVLSVARIDARLTGQPRRAAYRLPLPPDLLARAARPLDELLAGDELWVDRTRPTPKRVDVRPYIKDARLTPDALEFELWVTPAGTARPDEVLGFLGLRDAAAVLERTELDLIDELPPGSLPLPPALADRPGPKTLPAAAGAASADRHHPDDAPRASWGASPNGPVVE